VIGDWLNPNFDDSAWEACSALAASDCTSRQSEWGVSLLKTLSAQSPNQTLVASWLPNCSTVLNEVYFRVIIPQNDGQFPPVVFPLYETPIQINRTNVGYVNIPSDFSLSFDITPKGIISGWGSIIHFTGNGKDLSRFSGIWFHPNTNNLSISFSGVGYSLYGLGFTNVLLPANPKTQVQVIAVGVNIELLFNGTLKQYRELPAATNNNYRRLCTPYF
jgi:hypothetical protein